VPERASRHLMAPSTTPCMGTQTKLTKTTVE
jgi:hypothetical protein